MNRMFWNEFCWPAVLFASFSTKGWNGTVAVPGGSPTLVPIPGLPVAPKPPLVPPPKPPPPPNSDEPVPVAVAAVPNVLGLLPPKSDVRPPPIGVDEDAVVPNPPPPPPPNPDPPAVAVEDPKRPPPVVVAVPNAGLAPKAPPAGVEEPKAPSKGLVSKCIPASA